MAHIIMVEFCVLDAAQQQIRVGGVCVCVCVIREYNLPVLTRLYKHGPHWPFMTMA